MSRFHAWLSEQHWLAHGAMRLGMLERAARRYVAGLRRDDGIRAARRFNEQGMAVSLDVLGERVRTKGEARAAAGEYDELLGRIRTARLDANIAVKLTHLGLDASAALCRKLLAGLLARAEHLKLGVHIDMEGRAYTTRTLDMYLRLRKRHPRLGITLQAALKRTPTDLARIIRRKGPHTIRLVKGVYPEPAAVALQQPESVKAAYARLAHQLFRSKNTYPAIATHDVELVGACKAMAAEFKRADYEFQLLYGVRPDLAKTLAQDHRVRIYVPFGTEWYPYWMRRIAEYPAALKDAFRR